MKGLKDYTIDELKEELKRREAEAQSQRSKGRSHRAEYAYTYGFVVWVSDEPYCRQRFRVRIPQSEIDKHPRLARYSVYGYIDIVRNNFTKDTAPRVGDTVRIKSRKTAHCPDGFGIFSGAYICEIIKRAED